MITGHATVAGTSRLAGRHTPLSFNALGTTGLLTSQAGFGCYRITSGVAGHEAALHKAFASGINLIDTSANYADGQSEVLVGKVLRQRIEHNDMSRDEVIIVSKVGYLQGANFQLSAERKKQGTPFKDLVEYAKGLEHCIHPEFIADQLDRSLERLQVETIDFYLLHNPEYYLSWDKAPAVEAASREYYRRIAKAFGHLEREVAQGRIRYYGISSNTFPASRQTADFTCLQSVWEIAEELQKDHHFRMIQFPMNLLETGAATEFNQPDGSCLLQAAVRHRLATLINRPLNAFTGNKLIRLADIDIGRRQSDDDVIIKIRAVARSEKKFWRGILPKLSIGDGLRVRIKDQLNVADTLKHYWRNFGSYERFEQVRKGMLLPRVQGVIEFLEQNVPSSEELDTWMTAHMDCLHDGLNAVASVYGEAVVQELNTVKTALKAADSDWGQADTMSQKAIRALRTTTGVSSVLVGMRHSDYVADVLADLERPSPKADHLDSWQRLTDAMRS